MKHWAKLGIVLLFAPALAACGGEEAPEAVVEEPMAGMEGMDGMPMEGMGGMQMGGGMMDQMRAHMQAMEGATGEQLRANLPQHRQMAANMISQMNREMRDMNMAADQEWNSTIDAIRGDLVRLPEMTAQELEAFMPEHRARVMRLMEMHRAMMAEMGM
jgi:hypothetical protein